MGHWAIGVSIASRAFVSTDQFRISDAFDDSELSGPADNDNDGTSLSYSRNATPEPVTETCQCSIQMSLPPELQAPFTSTVPCD